MEQQTVRPQSSTLETRVGAVEEHIKKLHAAMKMLRDALVITNQQLATQAPKEKPKSKRRPRNKADQTQVMSLYEPEKGTGFKQVAEQTGIPESTVRSYVAMTLEEVAKLPEGDDE